MKKIIFSIGSAVLFLSVFSQQKAAAPKKPTTTVTKPAAIKPAAPSATILKTSLDSMSYAIGMLDGNFFKMQGITEVNSQLLGKGFDDILKNKSLMSPEQADQLIRREMQKMTRKKIQPNITEGEKFLAENAKRKEVKTTASGLQYEVIKEGTGEHPTAEQTIKIHYIGTLVNGKKFESSRDRGEPLVYPLNQMIKGWIEGVQLMTIGSRYIFYIPYQLGYGEQGSGETIPGGSALIFDLELIDIIKQ
ncbi:MAG: FKBP-type peptidyl-prolyl cis-trans isomerase [Chitinophagaceae bacterium]